MTQDIGVPVRGLRTLRRDYRPDIEGLRALAVISVIIHHFSKNLLPSGYLGVDIFFVISGYVISLSLMNRPAVSIKALLVDFYSRRVQRLLPALVACVVVTSALICLFDPAPKVSLKAGAASLFGLSNIYLFSQSMDYFAASAEVNVFTHTWSLGVEEQFYVIFPCLVWLSGLGRSRNGVRRLFWFMSAGALASFVLFVWLDSVNPFAAYFLMPARFWELAAGCLLFLGLQSQAGARVSRRLANLGWMFFVALLATLCLPTELFVYSASLAVVLVLLLIAALHRGSGLYLLLTHPWVVFIGSISYSLYLWHWSVLSLSRWTIGIHGWTVPFQVALMLALAVASYKYLENPIRQASWLKRPRRTIGYGFSLSLAAVGLCALLLSNQERILLAGREAPQKPPSFLPVKGSDLPYDPTCVVDGRSRLLQPKTFDLCTVPPTQPQGQRIWALGDSHAGHLQGLLYALHDQIGVGVHLIETPGVAFPLSRGAAFEPRQIIFSRVLEHLRSGDIVLVSRLFIDREQGRPVGDLQPWSEDLRALAETLSRKDVAVVVVGPPPMFEFESLNACIASLRLGGSCDVVRLPVYERAAAVYGVLQRAAAQQGNLYVFNSFDVLCPEKQAHCSPFRAGSALFRDMDHLNSLGAASLAEPFAAFLHDRHLIQEL